MCGKISAAKMLLTFLIPFLAVGLSCSTPELNPVTEKRLQQLLNIRTAAGNSSILLNSPANDLQLSSNSSKPKLVFGEWKLRQLLPVGGSVRADAAQLQPWLGSSRGSLRSFGVDLSGVSEQFDLLIGDGGLGGSFRIGVKYFVTFAACSPGASASARCRIASAKTSFTIQEITTDASVDAGTAVALGVSALAAVLTGILLIYDIYEHGVKCNSQVTPLLCSNNDSNQNVSDSATQIFVTPASASQPQPEPDFGRENMHRPGEQLKPDFK